MSIVLGSGEHRYRVVEDWAKLPEGWAIKDVAAVACDRKDQVYVFNRGEHPMIVFDRDGNFLRSWGEGSYPRAHGLHTTAHAGEAAGPESVRGALDALRVERIGHGIRAIEDDALVDRLAASQVPLEVCPLSNVATGVVGDIRDHPIRRLFDRGVRLTLNTDDPGMFGNDLVTEYRTLAEVFGFTADEIRGLILNAVDAAFLPADRRAALRAAFEADPAWAGP